MRIESDGFIYESFKTARRIGTKCHGDIAKTDKTNKTKNKGTACSERFEKADSLVSSRNGSFAIASNKGNYIRCLA